MAKVFLIVWLGMKSIILLSLLLDFDFSNINPIDNAKTNSGINNEDIDFSIINPIDEIIINNDRNNEDIEEELFDDLENIFKEKFIKNESIESSEKII